MKIFEFRYSSQDVKEWVCANTIIEAIKTYCSITGVDLIDFNDDDDIIEIPKEDWHKYNIIGEQNHITFEQYISNPENNHSDIIAGTPYLPKAEMD